MKTFDIPSFYRSSYITRIKEDRKTKDKRKKDFTPTVLNFGSVDIILARHFGFCYGVENAIEVSYKAIEENPNKNIFLLSQMIHNPVVNVDLQSRGIKFLSDTLGNKLMDWDELKEGDIVIVPAFGTSVEIMDEMEARGVDIKSYNTTCPFVEKVWTRSSSLGDSGHTVIIHGKYKHEETRATFSHSKEKAPSVVVLDMKESERLTEYILGNKSKEEFYQEFEGKYSVDFDPEIHFNKVGVVNQTTMLATETQEIADYFKQIMIGKYGEENVKEHFADTRDTLCYATNDNQQATLGLLNSGADMVLVVGGYNSSNTTHLVEICEEKFPVYFIAGAGEIKSESEIHHFDIHKKEVVTSYDFLPKTEKPKIVVTSGASCPDSIVEEVIGRVLSFYPYTRELEEVISEVID